jgi:hypothetical protein
MYELSGTDLKQVGRMYNFKAWNVHNYILKETFENYVSCRISFVVPRKFTFTILIFIFIYRRSNIFRGYGVSNKNDWMIVSNDLGRMYWRDRCNLF